jgi:Tfp pilus assembly protein PilE
MTVILILAAMVLGTAKFATEKSKRAKAEADMRKLSDVAEMSYAHYGEYTKTPFTAALATDPWGMPYLYSNYCVTGPGFTQFQAYAFYSFGPDMAPGDKRNPLSQLGDGDDMVVGNYGRKWGRVKE